MTLAAFPETADIETSSEDYASRFAGPVGDWFLKVQEAATLRMLQPYPGSTVLDVGGGHGQTIGALVENGYRLTILGSSESCADRVASFVNSGQAEFRVGDILHLPYPDRAFDVVLSYRLLPHVTRWQAYLQELTRVANQAVILDYPEVRSINAIAPAFFSFKKQLEGNTRTYTCYREKELNSFFAQQGFVKAERFAEFFWPMVLHRKLKQVSLSVALEGISRKIGLTGLFGSPVIMKWVRRSQGGKVR